MIINFDNIAEKQIEDFKGGKGNFIMRMIDNSHVKIMRNILPAGSKIGKHTHNGDYEIMFILKGCITFIYDGNRETASAGEIHYCPNGHAHEAINETDNDAEFLAIVANVNEQVD